MATHIQSRGDTAANWTSVNPVLADRELGLETDTRKFKFGDGVTAWASLSYASSGGSTLNSWNMSTDLFPAGATFGYRAYGINGPTSDLEDRFGDPIPDGSFIECIKVSGTASTTDPLDWAIYTTIIPA